MADKRRAHLPPDKQFLQTKNGEWRRTPPSRAVPVLAPSSGHESISEKALEGDADESGWVETNLVEGELCCYRTC